MKLNEAVYSIREAIRQYSDDSSIDDREIIFEINTSRAVYYRQLYNQKSKVINELSKQSICLTFEEVTASQCGCVDTTCTILKSTEQIPGILELHYKKAVSRVSMGNMDSIPTNFISWNRFIYSGSGKYGKNAVYTSLNSDGYLYLKSPNKTHKIIDCAYITAVFENPLDATDFNHVDGTPCFNKNTDEYPIEFSTFKYIQDNIIKHFLRKLNVPEDKDNNATDDTQLR